LRGDGQRKQGTSMVKERVKNRKRDKDRRKWCNQVSSGALAGQPCAWLLQPIQDSKPSLSGRATQAQHASAVRMKREDGAKLSCLGWGAPRQTDKHPGTGRPMTGLTASPSTH